MRIAHFIQRYPPALGGSEAYFARLSEYLFNRGHAVTVFTTTAVALESFWTPDGQQLSTGCARENNVAIRRYRIAYWPGRRYMLKALSVFPHRLWQCLTMPCNPIAPRMWQDANRLTPQFDVVHATAFPYAWPIACAMRLAQRQRIPFFVTPFLHLGDPKDPHDPIRRAYTTPALLSLLKQADGIFVQTPSEHDMLTACRIPTDRLILQGLGVDETECTGGNREEARSSWGVEPEEVVVGHLANNSYEKGTIDFLKASAQLWQQHAPLRVVLAGPEMPNFVDFWQSFVSRIDMSKVIRLGVLDAVEKRDFFAGLDVFALPSRSDSFGLVLVEAWANRVPNVAYRAGGIADVVRHGVDGLLARCGDVSQLAAHIYTLVCDADLRQSLGDAGKRRIDAEFQWNEKLRLVENRYRNAICRDGWSRLPDETWALNTEDAT